MLEKLELNVQKPLRKYEAIVLLNPDTSLEEQRLFFEKYKEVVQSFSGSVFSLNTWGKRRLTHPIKLFSLALYFHIVFEAQTESIFELERALRIQDKVLRFMHTQLDSKLSLEKHLENFRSTISLSKQREQEKELRRQKKFSSYKNYQAKQ